MIQSLKPDLILLSALLFFAGFLVGPYVVEKEVRFLLAYPLWVWRHVQRWIHPKDPFIKMMSVIFLLNASSLLANILAGFLLVLPFVFAFLVGLNVAVITVKEAGIRNLWGIILNPVALIELPTTWISLSLGMGLGLSFLRGSHLPDFLPLLRSALFTYGTLILPLLAIAAFVEVRLIKWSQRLSEKRNDLQM